MAGKRTGKEAGRPRFFADAAKRRQLFKLLSSGCSRADAASNLGITIDTIANEAGRDRGFSDGLRKAESDGKINLILLVRKAAETDPREARWLLERKWWKEWAKRKPDEITPEQLANTVLRAVASILGVVPKKYHDKINAAIQESLSGVTGGKEAGTSESA